LHGIRAEDGKYLAVWKIVPGGGLKLLSEISGAAKYMDRADLPLSALQLPDSSKLPKPGRSAAGLAVQSLNNDIAELVVKRNGSEFSKYYTDDAIYMPYYMPMLIGNPAIDAYYREHEDPTAIIRAVHIGETRIVAA